MARTYDPITKKIIDLPDAQMVGEPGTGAAAMEAQPAAANRYPYGGSYWDNQYMTEGELKSVDAARQAAARGEISIEDAHAYGEGKRAQYGYSGGKHGDQYIPLQQTQQPIRTDTTEHTIEDVTARMANYENFLFPYMSEYNAKIGAVADRQPFSYDLDDDPAWQAYKKQYTREGRRASEDTMGQYAAMTGGMPSTAAMTASQQAGDYYAAQMTDKIPELYKLAYSMYADEANRNLSELSAMRGIYGDYYNQYKDRYGMLGDALSRATAERSYADTRADKAAKDAYDYAMATGDYSYLRDLGLDTSYLEKQRDKEMADLDKPLLSLAEVNAAIKTGNLAPNVLSAWEYYYGAPYSAGAAAGGGYVGGGGGGAPNGNGGGEITYNTAIGEDMVERSKDDPNAAYNYLMGNWDSLNYQMKFLLMRNMGISANVANDLRDRSAQFFDQYLKDGGVDNGDSGDIYQQIFDAGIATEDEAKRYLQSSGMKYTEANDAAKTYMGLYGNGTFGNTVGGDAMMTAITGIKTEKDAVDMLEENGIMAKPLTREQWALDSGNSRFKTYNDYLKAFVYEYMNGG